MYGGCIAVSGANDLLRAGLWDGGGSWLLTVIVPVAAMALPRTRLAPSRVKSIAPGTSLSAESTTPRVDSRNELCQVDAFTVALMTIRLVPRLYDAPYLTEAAPDPPLESFCA